MFLRVAIKWLVIILFVLACFLVVLLFLGYLLKENEETTTQLKTKLDQEAYQQQEKAKRKYILPPYKKSAKTAFEKSQQSIIDNNLTCQNDAQCFLVHTNSPTIGCIAAVNTTGAVILLKVASEQEHEIKSKRCLKEYEQAHEILAQCRNNVCSL